MSKKRKKSNGQRRVYDVIIDGLDADGQLVLPVGSTSTVAVDAGQPNADPSQAVSVQVVREESDNEHEHERDTAVTIGFAARREPGRRRRGRRKRTRVRHPDDIGNDNGTHSSTSTSRPSSPGHDYTTAEETDVDDMMNTLSDDHLENRRKNILHEWLPYRDRILDELHRGDAHSDDKCEHCSSPLTSSSTYRCIDCMSQKANCAVCMAATHKRNPLHRIERWTGTFWEKSALHKAGLVLHLLHSDGECPNSNGTREMQIISSTGLHTVTVVFCNCTRSSDGGQTEYTQLLRTRWFPATFDVCRTAVTFECLSLFHLLTLQGKLTGYDFYLSIVRLGDNADIDPPPKRYDEFMRICRLWRHLKMLRRSGISVRPGGVDAAKDGSCAVQCPACPDPINVPRPIISDAGVETAKLVDFTFLDALYLMVDANFRLKNKDRPKIRNDFPIGSGLAYFVRVGPYKEYLANCAVQTEINICDSGLHAVDHANTRGNDKYLSSGVGAAQCRHMLVRPNGVGDLQKGEKYANMDYIFWSAVKGTPVRSITISYDIACQWWINLAKRIPELPPELQVALTDYITKFVIPKFHISAHGKGCQTTFSLNYRRGMARVDGENIERGWAWMNPASLSTREMGPGARQDTLDDQWSSWNWRILVRLGSWLHRRLLEAVVEAREHRTKHSEFTATFSTANIDTWTDMIEKWNADPHGQNGEVKDPYQEPEPEVTMADVRRELNEEEDAELENGIMPPHQTSASRFLVVLLELEEQQRVLKLARDATKEGRRNLRTLAADDKESTLKRKIKMMQVIQQSYMPGITTLRAPIEVSSLTDQLAMNNGEDIEDEADSNSTHEHAYDVRLYPPSAVPRRQREHVCVPGLVEKERRLRLAQAEDALNSLRRNLRIGATIFDRRHLHTAGTGTRPNTRMQSLQDRYKEKELRAAHCYIAARSALVKLDPTGSWKERLLELEIPRDLRPPMRGQDEPSEGRRMLSWIWRVQRLHPEPGGMTDGEQDTVSEQDVEEGLRVEWCKSLARAERWEEEVLLIREEMRRILVHLDYKAHCWRADAGLRSDDVSPTVAAGIRAYAERQAQLRETLAHDFAVLWLEAVEHTGLAKPVTWPAKYRDAKAVVKRVQRRVTRSKLIKRAQSNRAAFNPLVPSDNDTDDEESQR